MYCRVYVLPPAVLQSYFRTKVRQYDDQQGGRYGTLRIAVRREHVFEDSFHQLRSRTPEEMRLKLSVSFQVRAPHFFLAFLCIVGF